MGGKEVVKLNEKADILIKYFVEGQKIREIARNSNPYQIKGRSLYFTFCLYSS